MQIHEIINDDLTIHYILQIDNDDMHALKLLGIEGEKTFNGKHEPDTIERRAAFIATLLAVYPITTYEDKMRQAALQKPH